MVMLTAKSREAGMVVTRDVKTEQRYRREADRLLGIYTEDLAAGCVEEAASHDERYLSWCAAKSQEYAPASWRLFRAALAWAADQKGQHGLAQRIRDIGVTTRSVPARGAAKKLKGGAMPSLEILLGELHASVAGSAKRQAADWMVATLITGLRPTEWLKTEWIEDGDGPRLRVWNLKVSNDRANGETRTIWLHRAPREAIERVTQHREAVSRAVEEIQERAVDLGREVTADEAFASHMGVVRSALSRANRKIWPRKGQVPSLYTCRHQFAANAKAYGHGFEGVAALMGHASSATAYQHYARATSGRPDQCWADPDPAEVATVRDGFASWRQRRGGFAADRGITHEGPGPLSS